MQLRRVQRTRIGVESLEGRQLTTSISTEAISPPDVADVQVTADAVDAAQADQDVAGIARMSKYSPRL